MVSKSFSWSSVAATFNPDEQALDYGVVTMAVFALEFLQ